MSSDYGQQVPAVRRAVEVLRGLSAASAPRSLAELSRSVGASPSSVLAVLNTLHGYGLVERRASDGRYLPGPGLALLGTAAHRRRVAQDLVDGIAELVHQAFERLDAIPADRVTVHDSAGPIGPAELDEFLEQGLVATLSYLSDDGYPATVPLWFRWDGSAFWLVPRAGSEWAAQVRRNPRVSLAVSESTPPFRRVLARGRAEWVADESGLQWRQVGPSLTRRYSGLETGQYLAQRPAALLCLRAERLVAWRGLVQHPGASAAPAAIHPSASREQTA